MAHVRETIDLLTKVLRSNGTSKIKAEVFRLAKFDKNEAVGPLWKLLFELLYFLEHEVIDEVAVKACNDLSQEELVVFVKRTMQDRGFLSHEFSQLPNDMSAGSRELLLALAWLLCSEFIVDKFMENCASPLDYEFPKQEMQVSTPHTLTSGRNLSAVDKVKQLQLLNGKLHQSLKRLYCLQREKTRFQHKVHVSTQGVVTSPDNPHLSVLELHLLRHPDYLKKILKLLEKDNVRLQNLLQWKSNEDIFWKWMESVLELKKDQRANQGAVGLFTHYNIPPDLVGLVTQVRQHLEAAILKYEPIINQLEEIWETKRIDLDESDLDSLLSAIDLEISMHQARIQSDLSQHNKPVFPSEPRMQYIRCANKKPSNNRPVAMSGTMSTPSSGAEELQDLQLEISRLESHLNRLDVETQHRERRYRQELDSLASNIPDAICIMPSSIR